MPRAYSSAQDWRAVPACLELLGLPVACLELLALLWFGVLFQRAWSFRISCWRANIACLAFGATQVWLAALACLDPNVCYSGLACCVACLDLAGLLRYGVLF